MHIKSSCPLHDKPDGVYVSGHRAELLSNDLEK